MKSRGLIIFLFWTLLIASCKKQQEEKFVREDLFFRNDGLKMIPDTLPISFKQTIENGKYTLKDESSHIISEGKFSNGFRDGLWTYHPTDTTTLEIDWSKYVNDSSKVKINYPGDWKTLEDPERPFQAVFPLRDGESDKGKYFIILSHNKDSIDLDLFGYQRYYKSETFSTEKVKQYAHYLFETVSGKKFYFMRYVIQRGEEELSVFTFIGERGSQIYDITYSSRNENYPKKHIIFFDMIRSLQLNNEWFFSPYDPVKTYDRFEYQDQPQTTT